MAVPILLNGAKRQWVECKECGQRYYYDYTQTWSIPVMALPCGHDAGKKFTDAVIIVGEEPPNMKGDNEK